MKSLVTKLIVLGVLCLAAMPLHFASAAISEPGFEVETITGGLTLPTAMAFAPDGRIFIAEKGGTVRVVKDGVLLPNPVITLTDVNTFGDRGLIGIAVDPNFSVNQHLYLSYTYENSPGSNFSGQKTGRIVQITLTGDTASESSKVVILGTVGGNSVTPSCDDFPEGSDCIPSDSISHSVGGLRFGPDGYLYATFGDGANFDIADPRSLRAQDLDSLAGKMVRINTDGTAPTINPFYTGDANANRSKVFASGLRNGFRFNFQPGTGSLYLGDVGWSNWEEINRMTAGANYGWPCYEGVSTTTHNCVASGVTNPTYFYGHDVNGAGSVTAGAFPDNNVYPAEYDNSLFIGDYAQNWIKRLVIDSNNNVTSVVDFMDNPDGPVDISTGLDGNIYYLSIYTGELHRLTHTDGNRHPVPEVTANITAGLAPLAVDFSSLGTLDPDGDAITYAWDFGDGVISDLPNPTHEYLNNGTYLATLTVTDAFGSAAAKSVTITVGNQKPVPVINTPSSGSLYSVAETIHLNGTAADAEDGVLDPSALNWQIILHHNTHIHIIQEFAGVANPEIIAPDHDSDDVYLEVLLSATDSGGLTSTASINLYQNTGIGAGNLISNPSLEIEDPNVPGTPDRWVKGGFGVNDPVFTYPVAGYEGTNAAKLEVLSYIDGNAKWYFDPVFVSPGKEYLFTHDYTANVDTLLVAQYGLSNGTYQYAQLAALPATTDPVNYAINITIPDGINTLTVFHELDQIGVLTVDNYSLTLVQPPADVTPPVVTITSPAATTVVSGTITVTVDATDDVGVEHAALLVDGVQVGVDDLTAPYEFLLDTTTLAEGVHTLSAFAHDVANNQTTSSLVTITVSNTVVVPPPVNLVANATMETAAAADPNKPENWSFSHWGNHTAVATYPVLGHDGNQAARVEITSYPVGGDGDSKWYFTPINVTEGIEYTYSDFYRSNTISDIIGQYTLTDGTFHYFGLAKEIQPSDTWQQVTGTFVPPAGAVKVTFFHLISSVGFVEIDDVDLHENGVGVPSELNPPTVTITNPLANATVSGEVGITADSFDDTAVTYIFYAVDGIPVTGQITTAPYAFAWDTSTLTNGPHTLKATTHDPFGNNSTHTITVTVNNVPPASTTIINPSLETVGLSGDPEHWLRGGWGTNDRTYTYPVVGPSADSAGRIDITSFTNGDAKWFFEDVTVTGGGSYTFTHSYRSNVDTNITARYTKTDGTIQYVGITTLPPAATWTSTGVVITAPADAVTVTIFHSLISIGWLEVDDYSLNMGIENTFSQGMVSLTFDDGWVTHYTEALPILDTAGLKGSFYVVSDYVNDATNSEKVLNSTLETIGLNGDPEHWLRGGWGTNDAVLSYPVVGNGGGNAARVEITNYTDGDAKWYFEDVAVAGAVDYTVADSYNATVPTEVLVRYTMSDNTVQYVHLATLAATGGAWQTFSQNITSPVDAVSLTLFHVLAQVGTLDVDNYSVKPLQLFIDIEQTLALEAAGHEVGAHSKTHPDLTTLTLTEADAEISGSRTAIEGFGVNLVDTFVYPFGGYNTDIKNITQAAGFIGARSVDRGFNIKTTDKFALKIQQISRTTTQTDIQAWIDQAVQDKTWLILMYHQIDGNLLETLGTTPEELQSTVDYLVNNNVSVVTMRDGLALMNP